MSQRSTRRPPFKRLQKGFSFVEVFILVVVFSLFIAAALPTNCGPTTYSFVSELVLAGSSAKTALTEGMEVTHSWSPVWMSSVTISSTGMIASATIGPTGQIVIHGREPTSFAVVTMTPTITDDFKLVWSCTGSPKKYMPASCRQ